MRGSFLRVAARLYPLTDHAAYIILKQLLSQSSQRNQEDQLVKFDEIFTDQVMIRCRHMIHIFMIYRVFLCELCERQLFPGLFVCLRVDGCFWGYANHPVGDDLQCGFPDVVEMSPLVAPRQGKEDEVGPVDRVSRIPVGKIVFQELPP